MIESLQLTNWQNHKDRFFELDPITVFVGENDTGKSAILRALRWLCLNEWEGEADGFITFGEQQSDVCVDIEGSRITRRKGSGNNTYLKGKEEYKAFGTRIPSEITRILNITRDNFANQGDAHFWLSLSSPDAARALNEIFNLEEIDNTLSNAASEVRQSRSRVSVSKERLDIAKKQKQELDWTRQADKDLKQIESLTTQLQNIEAREEELKELYLWLKEAEDFQRTVEDKIQAAEEILQLWLEYDALIERLTSLVEILNTEKELEQCQKSLQSKSNLLSKAFQDRCPLCGRK